DPLVTGVQTCALPILLIGLKDVPHFIEADNKYTPAGPAGYKPTRGEEQEEGRDAHLSQEFQPSDQPIPGGSHRPQTEVQEIGIRSEERRVGTGGGDRG